MRKIMEYHHKERVLIEFGSNTTKVLVAKSSTDREGCLYSIPLRLAAKITKSGKLLASAVSSMMKIISDVQKRFPHAQEVILVGTEALRRANNREEIQNTIYQNFKLKLRILSWQEEAEAAFRGVQSEIHRPERIVCFDIGGSSTEIIQGHNNVIEHSLSFRLGAVDLSRKYILRTPLTNCMFSGILAEICKTLIWKAPASFTLVGIGGSVYTCAQVALNHEERSQTSSEAYKLSKSELFRQMQTYRALNVADIAKIPGIDASRADIILPAVMIMLHILEISNSNIIVVSNRGVRHGIMWP
ncbi:MAG: hypothetical protein PHN71_00625 [Candidatus Cloacimonetes bacterium]|nr:hypothetical protein [Candidatus Cloacimonadota bacterium]